MAKKTEQQVAEERTNECMAVLVKLSVIVEAEGMEASRAFALRAASEEASAMTPRSTIHDVLLEWLVAAAFTLAGSSNHINKVGKQNKANKN